MASVLAASQVAVSDPIKSVQPSWTTARPLIHLWIPNMLEFKGGIQTYSEFLLQALQREYPEYRYTVVLKHDTGSAGVPPGLPRTQFHFAGAWPLPLRTAFFAAQLLILGLWQRPQLIITTHANFARVAYWLNRFLGIPYWIVAHGVEVWDIQQADLNAALRQADRILAVSEYTRDRLLKEQSLPPQQIDLLPNTFEAERFQIGPRSPDLMQRYGLTSEQRIILTVARLDSRDRYKGYDQILQALPQIRQQIPTVHYLLVGKGDDRPRIEALIAQLHLEGCVTLAGFVPDTELAAHYQLCDVFAMPSKGEGFGIVYLEALGCGKPTLGGCQDGALDALCGGELGVLVDPDRVEAIALALTQILDQTYPHPCLYQPELLRQRVIDIYGFQRFCQRLRALIATSPVARPRPLSRISQP